MNTEYRFKSKAHIISVILLIGAISTIIIPVSGDDDTSGNNNSLIPVEIALMIDNTGPLQYFWPGFYAASAIAVDYLNDNQELYEFSISNYDTQCDYSVAESIAQDIISDGVELVVGAMCSGASKGANEALSSAGIPHISPASTDPELSNISEYPGFYRLALSDGYQGIALAEIARNYTSPALIHMTNSYAVNIAESFEDSWLDSGKSLCTNPIGVFESQLDFSDESQLVMNSSCDSVILISYSTEGAGIIEELTNQGWSGQIFGSDGISSIGLANVISDSSLLDGIITLNPSTHFSQDSDNSEDSNKLLEFQEECSNNSDCANGIFTSEVFDAVALIGEAFILSDYSNETLEDSIRYVGYQWEGVSSEITFNENNGDVAGNGFSVFQFIYNSTNSTVYQDFKHSISTEFLVEGFNFEPDSPLYGLDVYHMLEFGLKEIVHIALLHPITGVVSQYSPGFMASAKIATNHLNHQQEDYWFDIVEYDSACSSFTAANSAQSIIDDGINLVIGPFCSGAVWEANDLLFNQEGIPHISPTSTNPDLSAFDGFFRVVPTDDWMGNALSAAMNISGSSSPAMVKLNEDWGHDVQQRFYHDWTNNGNTVCTDENGSDVNITVFSWSDSNYISGIAQQITSADCDGVVIVASDDLTPQIISELKNMNFTGNISVPEWFDLDFLENKSHAENLLSINTSIDYESERANYFWTECELNYSCNDNISIFQGEVYDAVSIIAESFILSEILDLDLNQSISYIGYEWEGASSEITFNSDGDVSGPGYDICKMYYHSSNESISANCDFGFYMPEGFKIPTDNILYGLDVFANDSDQDGMLDPLDHFPNDSNEWQDSDLDGIGDNSDAYPSDPLEWQDSDGDGVGDNSDAFPNDTSETVDSDGDGVGDNSDSDVDGDGVENDLDAFPLDTSEGNDTDGDGVGDNLDNDDDGDGVEDDQDAFPLDPSETMDFDGDNIGDNSDIDDDNDMIDDELDLFPYNSAEWEDSDGDNIGDNADTDDDGDGWPDDKDAFPLDPSETLDSDGDGIGDKKDEDDDNDGLNDSIELEQGTDPLLADSDADGHVDSEDIYPLDPERYEDSSSLSGFGSLAALSSILFAMIFVRRKIL